ncbi:MAG TPA: cobalt ECF transporter T component CbiQ [Candidatus Limnocylindria bacterium]|nr:cobalt ECF transporter T component CbiQ [Candidatus Limnocylindria bacterium]
MELDRAIARDSPIHRADPRLKLVATVATILAITLVPVGGFAALVIAWAGLTVASTVAQLGPFRLSRGAFIAAPFLLAAVPLIVVRTGNPLGSIGPFTISGEGLVMFATIALKSWLSVQAALLLTFTTPFHLIVDAMRDLRVPRILVGIVSFMVRYLAVLGDEATRMLRARAARSARAPGGRGGGSIGWRARVTGQMVGSLFLRSYERSERIYAAMQARGFEGTFRHLAAQPVRAEAWAVFGLLLALLAGYELAAHLVLPRA